METDTANMAERAILTRRTLPQHVATERKQPDAGAVAVQLVRDRAPALDDVLQLVLAGVRSQRGVLIPAQIQCRLDIQYRGHEKHRRVAESKPRCKSCASLNGPFRWYGGIKTVAEQLTTMQLFSGHGVSSSTPPILNSSAQ